ncbi:metal ABC transporter ATP-binding protein [Candidatus Parcubacteria bacterium]|nr:metal ABC transporter ATP-binding protein [Candidatus Parcubacteria bacterium]
MVEKILEVKNLNVELGGEKIICNLSFELKEGEVLTILGPNGAGKTVLLKTLLGIFPFGGEIKWKEGIKIGYVPQRVPFVKDFPISIKEFFELKGAKENETKEILKTVGFDASFLKKPIGELSSGQYQRILVAWALLQNPKVLLFDEPTTGVDILGQETIYQLLERLKKEKNLAIILVTHDLSVVFKFSDYVICLNKCPICQGVPKEVLSPEILSKLYGQEIKFYQHYHQH